jgi:LL-diaminopimelate aminotransferase
LKEKLRFKFIIFHNRGMRINEHYTELSSNYLFADIAKKVQAFLTPLGSSRDFSRGAKAENPEAEVISLGIGDVTQPLCPAVVEALHKAVDEMGQNATFRGYGPERGYDFLRNAIVENDFHAHGINIKADEVFVSDGAKSDTGNFQELLADDCIVAVTDPIYPVYVDSNVMAGRRIVKLPCTTENNFVPALPQQHVDVIYLCYPNNPTGTTLNKEQLKKWVDYALENNALIFYDTAYEAYIQSEDIPHSIYEIPGAINCAVEFHSYSKTAGFTGVRCGYTVVPTEIKSEELRVGNLTLNQLWNRRQCTKFNGTSYLSQRAAEAIYTPEGKAQIRATIKYYMENAQVMLEALTEMGFKVYGGKDAPYLWVSTPKGMNSWGFFDWMLRSAHVVCTPGAGFGPSGEGFVRLTAFGTHENTEKALRRIANRL